MSRNFQSSRINTRVPRKTASGSSFGKIILTLVIIGIALLYMVWSVGGTTIIPKKYNIEKGYTLSELSGKLGFDVADWRYKLWLKLFGPKVSIPAGTYETQTGTTIRGFLTETIKKPLYSDLTITILPGWSMYDIDAYLAQQSIAATGDLLETARLGFSRYQSKFPFLIGATSLEGYLYPDTYRIRQDATVDDIIETLLGEFDKKIGSTYKTLDAKKAYETLILASIVEREERNATNQPIVAGILSKRVKEGIALGADATVCYGYAKTQKQCTPTFIGSIITDDNPYNTRKKRGYTPTPIASIPLSAWEAALRPESSPYYYYLHDSSGQIHYARTNDEHNTNRQKYLQ